MEKPAASSFSKTEPKTISASDPDWSRERPGSLWDPGRRLLRSIRGYQRAANLPPVIRWVARKYWVGQHLFWSLVTGTEIGLNTKIGGGLLLPHPNGIVVHPNSVVGCNCLFFHQVTLGTNGSEDAPTLGGHVDIGAGAKLLGGIKVGDHAKIGANAVVLTDVPPGATAVGIPARIIPAKKTG